MEAHARLFGSREIMQPDNKASLDPRNLAFRVYDSNIDGVSAIPQSEPRKRRNRVSEKSYLSMIA